MNDRAVVTASEGGGLSSAAVHTPEIDALPDLTRRDRLSLWWLAFRRQWRRCPECERRGYGNSGPGPGRTYRWVDDPVVVACGFQTAPHRCNTCGQKPEEGTR